MGCANCTPTLTNTANSESVTMMAIHVFSLTVG